MMTDLHQRAARFAGHLDRLPLKAKEDPTARAILAELRTGLGRKPGEAARAWRHIIPYLAEQPERSDLWFYLVGTLFPLHPVTLPESEKRRSLGGSFGRIRGDLSKSAEARFLALLNADSADLPELLRGAISFLHAQSENVGVDWARLIRDLAAWDHPDRYVQATWAREFYHAIDSDETSPERGGTP